MRKVIRSEATAFQYTRAIQPAPKLGSWRDELDRMLLANASKARRERLTLMRVYEALRGLGYEGGYDAMPRAGSASAPPSRLRRSCRSPEALPPLAGAELRASLEEAAQTALDAADRIIAVLDRLDGDANLEDGGDAEPSLAAPENHEGSQVVYMRGNDQDGEEEVPEAALPELAVEPVANSIVLPWRGRGNVIAAAGTFLVDLLERALCEDRRAISLRLSSRSALA